MKCVCKVWKHGTLIYRANGDLLEALSTALVSKRDGATSNDHFSQVLDNNNMRLHNQIAQWFQQQEKAPFEHASLDVNETIDELDPVLWKTVRSHKQKGKDEASQPVHTVLLHTHEKCVDSFCYMYTGI